MIKLQNRMFVTGRNLLTKKLLLWKSWGAHNTNISLFASRDRTVINEKKSSILVRMHGKQRNTSMTAEQHRSTATL